MYSFFKLSVGSDGRDQIQIDTVLPATRANKVVAFNVSGKLPIIEVNYSKEFKTIAVIDTASSRTIMSKRFFNKIKSSVCVKSINKINDSIHTAGGNRITVKSEAKIHFKIKEFSWTYTFWICNHLPYDTILGFEFFKHSQMFCDVGKGVIGFKFYEGEVNFLLADFEGQPDNISLDDSELTSSQQSTLQGIMSEFGDVLTKKIGRANCLPYEIKFKGNPSPVQSRPYQCNPERMKALKSIIHKMLQQQIIEPTTSQ